MTPATQRLQEQLQAQMVKGEIPTERKIKRVKVKRTRSLRIKGKKERNAEILRLCCEDNKSHKEVAEIMGVAMRTVSNIITRHRKKEGTAKRKPGPKGLTINTFDKHK